MSDDSNLWDDDGVNWQEISSQVIDEASNPSTVATAAEESSTRHLVEGPVETVESVFPRERTVDASLQPSLNQRISNQTAPEWRTTPTSGSSRRHLGSTTQNSGRVQQRGVVKRTILALLEGSSPENDNRKNAKNKRRRNEGELGVGTKTNQETPPSSPTVTSSQAARIRGALDSYDDELSCPICLELFLAPQLLNPCGHSVCGDCITHWVDRNKGKPTCPTCRAELSSASPYLYNLAINNTVEKHIEMLRNNKDEGWKEDGVKWKERQVRKRTYEAIKSSKPDPPKRQISPWIESIADGFFGDWDIYEGREVAFVFHQNGTESRVVHRPNHHRIRGGRSRATSRRTEPTAVIEIPDSDEIEPRPAGSP